MAEQSKDKKRTTDKWKKKIWYTIYSSKEFGEKEIGSTVAEKPELVEGRIIKANLRTLANHPRKQHISVKFKVTDVKGNKAYTKAIGHEVNEGYLKRMIRRKSSKVETVQDASTKDNLTLRVKTIALCARKVKHAQQTAIGKITEKGINEFCMKTSADKAIYDLALGEITSEIFNSAKKVCPLKRIEVIKSQLNV